MPDARERILEATRTLCIEEGFAALTMRRVADRVGVTAPAIYRHFAGKAELIHAMLDEARGVFAGYLARGLEAPTPRARFDRTAECYLDFALEQPRAYEMLFLTPNQFGLFGMPSSVREWEATPPATFQLAVDRVAECMNSGDFKPGDPTAVALSISAVSHGMVAFWLAGRFGTDEDRFRQLYTTAISAHLEGIAT